MVSAPFLGHASSAASFSSLQVSVLLKTHSNYASLLAFSSARSSSSGASPFASQHHYCQSWQHHPLWKLHSSLRRNLDIFHPSWSSWPSSLNRRCLTLSRS